MLEMFEKLINEHGSSVILKERLELINDKYEALGEKLEISNNKNELLQKENEQLKQHVAEIQGQLSATIPKGDNLPQEQKDILKLLFNTDGSIREEVISHQVKLEIGILKYHLDELIEKELLNYPSHIRANSFTGTEGYRKHSISKNGRKCVVENTST
ncbi:MAG: hypothetical protein COB61_011280 [Thiotrichales bacterium]|nr:hypothetical protein [Thiotrichales bacterium]